MTLPSWQDKKLGGKARAALWLVTVVGEGNIFTKSDLRNAIPDAQIDRRVRELRPHGWKIATSREDPSLKQEEQRFVARGADVWIPGKAKEAKHKNSLTSAQRAKVFQRDNHLCRTCGIGSGEAYEDGIELAVLNVARRKVLHEDGMVEHQFITECKKCVTGGGADREVDLSALLELIENLGPMERRVFAGWIAADQRTLTPLDKVWGLYRTLPAASRTAVAEAINEMDS
ncbi:hypothetical protein ABZ354_06295 [Streptomyces sp. NPDC005925]|uniref:hypothetical protein n=1 Tax=Streptomyces sp. NPDC005925 TaxID=3157172 RepID=UPI003402BC2E